MSRTGTLVYFGGPAQESQRRLVWVDREGRIEPISERRDAFYRPRLSPDGQSLALSIDRGREQVGVYDLARDTLTLLAGLPYSAAVETSHAVWTPDGRHLTYSETTGPNTSSLFSRPADGSGPAEQLTVAEPGEAPFPRSRSSDGQVLVFEVYRPSVPASDIWMYRRSGEATEPLLAGPFNYRGPAFSPNGRWLAYESDESGRWEIYVQAFPGPGARWQISTDGGGVPRWAPQSGELFYGSKGRVMVVPVTTSSTFAAGRPRMLFERPELDGLYDVTADGQRFVMIDTSEEPVPRQISVILNWPALLARKEAERSLR